MSLTEKVIKNTSYYLLSQGIGFLTPLILTPIIIAKIGEVQFGIYAILLGFIGTFGVFDLGISSSFVKYISEYNIKKKYEDLNKFISTGFVFYIMFSVIVILIGYSFATILISIFNIPDDLLNLSTYAFKICLLTFFFSNITSIFGCILLSTHTFYKTSFIGIALHVSNIALTIFLLESGYGLVSIFYAQLCFSIAVFIINYYFSRQSLPVVKIHFKYFDKTVLKQMFKFGTQIQIARVAFLLSEKFDEFLLGYLTSMNNVTYFNTASKVVRAGKFFPMQLIPQITSAASELQAKEDSEKINMLFTNFTKYITVVCIPIFLFFIVYSDIIIRVWLGDGFETSAMILKILAVGQLINLSLSIPGNTLLPSVGLPRYIMVEGLLNLLINIIISYVLIINYGVQGAAIGSTIAIVISSVYLFIVCVKRFGKAEIYYYKNIFLSPVIFGVFISIIFYFISNYFLSNIYFNNNRIWIFFVLIFTGFIYFLIYFMSLNIVNYFNNNDKYIFKKIITQISSFSKKT